jgi:hypothetical protein
VGRERGRADEVDEHHGRLPPLGGSVARLGPFRRRLGGAERGGRAQHPFAVSEEDSEFFEIRLGQLGQGFEVDRVVAKDGCILREPETAQPVGDVHGTSPGPAHLARQR